MKHIIIYKTTNKVNGKYYIGKHETDDINDNYLGSGLLLNKAINKYGKNNFTREVLEIVDNETWSDRERYWINELNARDSKIGYNIARGGEGGDTISNHPNKELITNEISKKNKISIKNYWASLSEDERRKRNLTVTGDKNGMFGKEGYWKDKKIPRSVIEKGIKTKKENGTYNVEGKNNPNYNSSIKDTNCLNCGKTIRRLTYCSKECYKEYLSNHSEELRGGENNSFYGKTHSDETKKRMSEMNKARGYVGSQNIPFTIDDIEYKSLGEASRELGIHVTTIRHRLKSLNKKFENYKYVI